MRALHLSRPSLVVWTSIACCLLTLWPASTADAGQACTEIQVVFFDLGNTLVEQDPESGLFVVRPGVLSALDQLQALGTRLGVITNVPANWDLDDLRAVLEDADFLNIFEVVALSSQAPAAKPDPAIYLHAHGLLAGPPPITATAFVGETLSEIADAEPPSSGARAVGMVGIHLSNASPSPLADYTLPTDDMSQLVGIVESHGEPLFCAGFEAGDLLEWSP